MNELILYAVKLRHGWRIKTAEACCDVLPLNAVEIGRIDREDRNIMTEWAQKSLRAGYTLERLKKACDGEVTA